MNHATDIETVGKRMRSPWIVGALGLCLGLRLAYGLATTITGRADWPVHLDGWGDVAVNILNGRGFSLDGETPSAVRGPFFPLALSGFYRVFGVGRETVVLFQSLMDTLTGMLMVFLSCRLGLSRRATVFGLVVWALYFPHLYYTNVAMSEPFFTLWLMLALALLSRTPWPRGYEWILSSAAMGAATLVRPVAAIFALVVVALPGRGFGWRVAYAAVFCAALAPWAMWNNARLGHPIWGSTFEGYAAYTAACRIDEPAYTPAWQPDLQETIGRFEAEMRARGVDPAQMGEYERNRQASRLALGRIVSHPGRYARLVAEHFTRMMFCVHDFRFRSWRNAAVAGINALVYGLFIVGLAARARAPGVWDHRWTLLVAVVLANTVAYSLVYAISRYNNPMIPLFLLGASAGVQALSRHEETGIPS